MKNTIKKVLCATLVIVIFVTCFPLSYVSAETVQIPEDAVEFNGHYYKVYEIDKTWDEARSFCEDLGGHLVTVTSEQENNFVMSIIGNYYCFMGATDKDSEGIWAWVTGETWNYTNWMEGEPNNGENINECQNYLAMYGENGEEGTFGKWDDGWGEYHYFICEWENQYIIAGKTFNKNIDYFTTTSSSVYNPELANMTAALSKAAYGDFIYDEEVIKNAYFSLGFDEVSICDYDGEYNPMSSGCAIGFKKSDYNDDIICLVTVRGSVGSLADLDSDWLGNITILTTSDGKHIGFSFPADRIYNNIKNIAKEKNIGGNIKYVLTGHSRGAAVANLLAVKLMEKGVSASNVYGYNFACPDVACKYFFSKYNNVFNICNRLDFVTKIPGNLATIFTDIGTSWGKYGITYWFSKYNPNREGMEPDHDMEQYLEFLDQKKSPDEWEKTSADEEHDDLRKLIGYLVKIMCPVDVIVTDEKGDSIASVIGGEIKRYDGVDTNNIIILTDGDKKVIYISGDRDFNISLVGTDNGTMTYTLEEYNLITNEVSESKTFSDVKLEKGKEMYSPVSSAENTEDIELFVVHNENGEKVNTHYIDENGVETEIKHIYISVTTPATCTEDGVITYTCSCGDTYTETIEANGHIDSDWITDNNSTCSAEGSKHIECTVCEEVLKTEPIAKLPHNYSSVVTEATCEKGGYTTYTCTCGDTYTGDKTPAKSHDYAEGVCKNCGETKVDNCSCNCHNGGINGIIWKILRFFYKLFGMKKYCGCGVTHY